MTPEERPMRKHAQRNRSALVAAAREVLGRRGLQAPLDEIAHVAGVGNATLYRHFPARDDLLHAVFVDQLDRWTAIMDSALAMTDPWVALRTYLTEICQLQASNRAVAELVAATDFGREEWAVFEDQLTRLLAGARATGELRADVDLSDIVLVLAANAGVVTQFAEHTTVVPAASARLAALLIDGLQQRAANPAPPPFDFSELVAARALPRTSTTPAPHQEGDQR